MTCAELLLGTDKKMKVMQFRKKRNASDLRNLKGATWGVGWVDISDF
jgi:hypothetical protein